MTRPSSRQRIPAAHAAPLRRGGVYVAVLGVAMIIALVGLASLHLSRVEIDVLTGAEQIAYAEALAQSAVEMATNYIQYDTNWRTTLTNGAEVPPSSWLSVGTGGGIKCMYVDADGDLDDDPRDPVRIRGLGRAGEAVQVATVVMQPTGDPMSCLNVAFHSNGDLTCGALQTITCNQMVSSNDDINVVALGSINGDAWAVDEINGSVSGQKYNNQSPARVMPDATTVWDYYLANGTTINVDSIPNNEIELVVLSAGVNPYGVANPQGIYVVDCHGEGLTIQNCRINATLVIWNPGSAVVLDGRIAWDPPAANFPALMVDGDLTMSWSGGSSLDESTWSVNFNPASSPYANSTDADTNDAYPGSLNGLVYASGNFSCTESCLLNGVTVVGGAATFWSSGTVTYDPSFGQYPPPGFAAGNTMRVIPRTWRRAAR